MLKKAQIRVLTYVQTVLKGFFTNDLALSLEKYPFRKGTGVGKNMVCIFFTNSLNVPHAGKARGNINQHEHLNHEM